jgi:outer membrane protein assembly factor BamB
MFTRSLTLSLACGLLALATRSAIAGDVAVDSKLIDVTLREGQMGLAEGKAADGKVAWVYRVSNEPLPTPTYGYGKIFTGGGYGSTTFVAINAGSGKNIWSKTTKSNGPTSAVVADKRVAYNTESCHSEIRDEETGEMLWAEVTGGTLMTQPVIADKTVLFPHPANGGDIPFRMLGVSLKDFNKDFDSPMTGDVLSAPIVAGDFFYYASRDGRIAARRIAKGIPIWRVKADVTSAPVVVGDILAVTTQETTDGKTTVGIRRYDAIDGTELDTKQIAPTESQQLSRDGERTAWDFQGHKLAVGKKTFFFAPSSKLMAVTLAGETKWTADFKGANMLPPALGKENVYVCSTDGRLFIVKQEDGSAVASYKFPMQFNAQPVLAEGNIYIPTASGSIVCLKLGTEDAKDWHAWGGNSQHNKVD